MGQWIFTSWILGWYKTFFNLHVTKCTTCGNQLRLLCLPPLKAWQWWAMWVGDGGVPGIWILPVKACRAAVFRAPREGDKISSLYTHSLYLYLCLILSFMRVEDTNHWATAIGINMIRQIIGDNEGEVILKPKWVISAISSNWEKCELKGFK